MHNRKKALALAKQFRTCPPPDIAADPSQEENYRRHLAVCPYCSESASGGQEIDHALAWKSLAAAISEWLPLCQGADLHGRRTQTGLPQVQPGLSACTAQAGQLRRLRTELGRWRGDFFYTPPCVLVLDTGFKISACAPHADRSDDIWVAQTYHDITLAAPGDLILSAAQTGNEELLVECWNTYTLKAADLGAVEGTVAPDIIEAVKKLEADPESAFGRSACASLADRPDWAILPRPLVDHDPRMYFRELEVEVGYTFAAVAAAVLMAELQQPVLELNYSTPEDLKKEIRNILPGIAWPDGARSFEQLLAAATAPPEYYPLAASQEPGQIHLLKLVSLDAGRVRAVDFGKADIIMREVRSGGLTISGRVVESSKFRGASRFLCFLETEESILRAPDRLSWDGVDQTFIVTFTDLQPADGKLHLAVLYETDDV
jgi:hypothetical protein